ncbi:MAG: hypothetical protein HUK21_06780 [Fibrobacteraceae bacterium]|nr:hypothetical protein [Fibrobacteraceae bacterium]
MNFIKVLFLSMIFTCVAWAQGNGGISGAMSVPATTGIHTPFFIGGALEFGSGTGVDSDRGIGFREIEPMAGIWYPGVGFLRVGYGFYDYDEEKDEEKNIKVEHSDMDIELGIHLFGMAYILGTFSRSKDLSDLGDVAWNEWGAGFGTMLNIFSKTILFAEMSYKWVLDHYDPFLEKKISGTRIQFNLGFSVYVW